jgi:hypothetical protein
MSASFLTWILANVEPVLMTIGLIGLAIAFLAVQWAVRGEPEPIARWRYREPVDERSLVRDRSSREGIELARARRIAREMIVFAVLLPAVALFVWIAQPGHTGGGMFYEPPWYEAALPWAAAAGYLVGLVWMILIYRRSHLEPEPDEPIWRYRA